MEEWRPVVGYEGFYEVSDQGRVRSLDHERPNSLTGGVSKHPGKILTPVANKGGHVRVYMKGKRHFVHRLVCRAFKGAPPVDRPLVLHWDGVPTNNRSDNLRWGSSSDNEADKLRHGRNKEASKTHCPKGHRYDKENTRLSRKGHRLCRQCSRETNQERRDTGLRAADPRHGTNNGYLGYGCRCEPCRDAGRTYRHRRLELARSTRLEV